MRCILIFSLIVGFVQAQEIQKTVKSKAEILALSLETTSVIGHDLTDDDVKALAHLTKLREVDLRRSTKLSIDGAMAVAKLPKVTRIQLPKPLLTSEAEFPATLIKKIRCIDWGGIHQVDDKEVASLARFTNVEVLNFRNCNGISPFSSERIVWEGNNIGVNDKALRALAPLKNLSTLNVDSCQSVTDDGLRAIANQFPLLQELNISSTTVTDKGIAALARLKRLQTLDASNLYDISGAGLAILSELPLLRTLNLEWCTSMRSAQLMNLRHGSTLENLNLTYCKNLDARTIEALQNMPALKCLNVFGLKWVDDQTLPAIAKLKKLEELNIGAPGDLTDQGLKALRFSKSLKVLGLQAAKQITFAGIKALAPLELKEVNVYFTQSDFNDEAFGRFARSTWPGCKVRLPSGKMMNP